jgi:hypothetical protein
MSYLRCSCSSLPPVVCRRSHALFTMFCSSLPPVVCRRTHVLFTMLCSSLPPVVCKRTHVLFTMFGSSLPPVVCRGLMSYLRCSARLYLQSFVGGHMSYLRQHLTTLPEHPNSPQLYFRIFFYFDHIILCPFSIYDFWYPQVFPDFPLFTKTDYRKDVSLHSYTQLLS